MNQDTVSAVSLLFVSIALIVGIGVAFTLLGTAKQTAPHDADEPGFVVDLQADGDARMHVTYTYNLTDEERKQAFSDLQDSESSQEYFRDEFESRLSAVAANASERVNRNMSVSNATIQLETVDDTGVVTVSISWHNLAGHNDDLVVTEPFTSGFFPDRPFYVVLPSDYTVSSVTPGPATSTDESLQWDAGTDLTGFELVLSPPTDDGTTDDSDDGGDDNGSTDGSDTDEDGETTDGSGGEGDSDTDDGDSSGDDTSDGGTNTDNGTDTDDGTGGDTDVDGAGFGILVTLIALVALVSLIAPIALATDVTAQK